MNTATQQALDKMAKHMVAYTPKTRKQKPKTPKQEERPPTILDKSQKIVRAGSAHLTGWARLETL